MVACLRFVLGSQRIRSAIHRWVYGTQVKNPGKHTIYDYTKSPGSRVMFYSDINGGLNAPRTPQRFDISYAFNDSRIQGFVVSDVLDPQTHLCRMVHHRANEFHQAVSVGATPPVWMAVEVATEVSNPFKNMKGVDGIIGLGFRDLNFANTPQVTPSKVSSFMERLIEGTKLDPPVFTVDFDPSRNNSKPTVEMGKIDPEKYSGDLAYAPVNNKDGWWAVDNVTFEVGGRAIAPKYKMIMDTGGAGIVSVSMEVAAAYHRNVKDAKDLGKNGTWYFPCSSPVEDLTLNIGNGSTTFTADQLKGGSYTPGLCEGVVRGNNGTYGNVSAKFFKKNYVIFDYTTPAIQYAPHN
ncbi:MAG: hypothetical protein Q9219_002647 [cf. Caloplaca sp. 3 TL-2023]